MEVKVVVDSGNTVLESNETNNEFTKTITVKGLPLGPDYRINFFKPGDSKGRR